VVSLGSGKQWGSISQRENDEDDAVHSADGALGTEDLYYYEQGEEEGEEEELDEVVEEKEEEEEEGAEVEELEKGKDSININQSFDSNHQTLSIDDIFSEFQFMSSLVPSPTEPLTSAEGETTSASVTSRDGSSGSNTGQNIVSHVMMDGNTAATTTVASANGVQIERIAELKVEAAAGAIEGYVDKESVSNLDNVLSDIKESLENIIKLII
jgi:hypothetical protein